MLIPNVLEQGLLGEDIAGMAHEESQQRELLRGEFEWAITAPGPMASSVEFDVANAQHRRSDCSVATKQ